MNGCPYLSDIWLTATTNTTGIMGGNWLYYNTYPTPPQEEPVSQKIKKGMHLVVRKSDGLVVAIEDSFEEAMDEARDRAMADEAEYIVFAAKKAVRPKPDDIEERDA